MNNIDRKQVLFDIERCTCHVPDACRDCSKHKFFQSPLACMEDLLKDAMKLLKKQEAVPATQREIIHMLFWCCGSCGVPITHGDKFCRMCGKKVEWPE